MLTDSIMTALLQLGAFVGAAFSGFVADRYSRRLSIFWGTFISIIGAAIQTAAENYATLVAGRFIAGIGTGLLSSTAPMCAYDTLLPHLPQVGPSAESQELILSHR